VTSSLWLTPREVKPLKPGHDGYKILLQHITTNYINYVFSQDDYLIHENIIAFKILYLLVGSGYA
jgi:hypothetical protein